MHGRELFEISVCLLAELHQGKTTNREGKNQRACSSSSGSSIDSRTLAMCGRTREMDFAENMGRLYEKRPMFVKE